MNLKSGTKSIVAPVIPMALNFTKCRKPDTSIASLPVDCSPEEFMIWSFDHADEYTIAMRFRDAVAANRNDIVRVLASKYGAEKLEQIRFDGESLLHLAIIHDAFETLQTLVELGCSVNVLNEAKDSLVECLLGYHRKEEKVLVILRYLFEQGFHHLGTPNQQNDVCYRTCLETGFKEGFRFLWEKIQQLLPQKDWKFGRIWSDSASDEVNIHHQLALKGWDDILESVYRVAPEGFSEPSANGDSLLHIAAREFQSTIETIMRLDPSMVEKINQVGDDDHTVMDAVYSTCLLDQKNLQRMVHTLRALEPRPLFTLSQHLLAVSGKPIEFLEEPLEEDFIFDVRFRVFFRSSLVSRLLQAVFHPAIHPIGRVH